MPIKKTHRQFIEEVFKIVGNEYSVLSQYEGANIKIKMRHNKCGNEYEVKPNGFLNGRRCPKCKSNGLKDTQQFKNRIYELVKDEYTVLGEYVKSSIKIKIKHKTCGFEYEVTPNKFIMGRRCPKCNGGVRNKTTDYFKKEVYSLVGDEYSVLEEYKKANKKILIKHNSCGNVYKVTPNGFLSKGSRCPICSNKVAKQKRTKSQEQFVKEIYQMVGEEYTVIGKYVNGNTKILIRHNICNHEYFVTPGHFQGSKRRCPRCNESHGEQKIRDYLEKNNIQFIKEFRIKNCKNKYPLPFDFAVFNQNKLSCLIEYDGIQHFEIVNIFGKEAFEKQKINDFIKNKYCREHGIKLIRIPYIIENIEQFLKEQVR